MDGKEVKEGISKWTREDITERDYRGIEMKRRH